MILRNPQIPNFTLVATAKKKIPFDFVLEEISALNPVVRPMFGCYALYAGEKIVLILRHRESHPRDNGVWVATTHEHLPELKRLFPSMRRVELLGSAETQWQVLPYEADDFEESVLKACDMVRRRDPRIGKVPKAKKKKAAKKKATEA